MQGPGDHFPSLAFHGFGGRAASLTHQKKKKKWNEVDWGDAPRHLSRGPPTPLLQQLLYLVWDRTGRLRFEKAKAHGDDVMNNTADALANEGHLRGRLLDISSLRVPEGWVDTAPVLCHQPLDFITKLIVRTTAPAPAMTIKFGSFSDRWTVTIGNMFGIVLDPGNHIKKVWGLTIPEGLKEVLWKEMNGAQVLGHRYYGKGHVKSDLGRYCLCGSELSLGHILLGCSVYRLERLMAVLMGTLEKVCSTSSFKTLSPDSWGASPWYPLLALKELEEGAFPIVKGQKKLLKTLKKTRQKREWIIGNYYWALWKWRMKEIHDKDFSFFPEQCADSLAEVLSSPVPVHLLARGGDEEPDPPAGGPPKAPGHQYSGVSKLPPVSLIGQGEGSAWLSAKGKQILRALRAPNPQRASYDPSRRRAILRALTDNAYT